MKSVNVKSQLLRFAALMYFGMMGCGQPYYLPKIKDWHNKIWKFPLEWAPTISHKGHEDMRFTPGWGKVNNEESWSYSFLWWIEENAQIDEAVLNKQLTDYYTGLVDMGLVLYKRSKDSAKDTPTIVNLHISEDKNSQLYRGTIAMWDYIAQRPITLNVTSQVKSCEKLGRKAVFFALSPQPDTHRVWRQFDDIWHGFTCTR